MIDLSIWAGKTIAVMGLGKTGNSAVAALVKAGIKTVAWDDHADSRAALKQQDALADLNTYDFSKIDALILSPGIPHNRPAPHAVAQKAIDAIVPIYCDIELFARAITDIPYVSITGTNGKSTTTALIAHILNTDRSTEVGGNLGEPVLTLKQRGVKAYVLELSSYQLERAPSLKPNVAVWLNITPDHIDRHGDLDGYINAKRKIFANQDDGAIAIIGVDDDYSARIADDLEARTDWLIDRVSVREKVEHGYYVEKGVLMRKDRTEDEAFMCTDLNTYPKLKGVHNWQNAACAFAACEAMGMSAEDIEIAMRDFAGLAHRQYIVDAINGIPYINDSKATNAQAASMALRSFENIFWIVGGLAKEGGLAGLEEYTSRIKHAFIIGAAQEEFALWFDRQDIPYTLCGDLDSATAAAHDMAQGERGLPGAPPVVLLAPACASFDQFKSFEARGDAFANAVATIKESLD